MAAGLGAGGRCHLHGGIPRTPEGVRRAAEGGAAYWARRRVELGLPPDWRIRKVRMTAAQWLARQSSGKPPSIQSLAAKEQWRQWRAERGLPEDWRYGAVEKPAGEWLAERGLPVPEAARTKRKGGRPRKARPWSTFYD
jgi:hypothetical protein